MSLEHLSNEGKSTSTGGVCAHRLHVDPNKSTRIVVTHDLRAVVDFSDTSLKEIRLVTPLSVEEIEKVYKHNRAEATGVYPLKAQLKSTNNSLPFGLRESH